MNASDHILAGRFRLELPSSVARLTQESTLRRVDIVEIDRPSRLSPAEASQRFWDKHVSEIKKARRNDNADTVIEEGHLDGRPYLHYSDPGACVPVFETLVHCLTHVTLFRADVTFHPPPVASAPPRPLFAAEALERQRRITLEVLGSYHAGSTPRGVSPDWFHTPRGIVASPYARQRELWTDVHGREHPCWEERLSVKLEGPGLELSFSTWHPHEDESWLWDRLGATSSRMERLEKTRGWSVPFTTLRLGDRTVAGFSGTEDLIRSAPNRRVIFRWRHFPGGDTGYDPRIELYASGKDVEIDRLIATWDQVLEGVTGLLPTPPG